VAVRRGGWAPPDWVPLWLSLPRHPKLARLALAGGVTANEAIGWLVRLWTYAAEFAPDGDLALSDAEILRVIEAPRTRRDVAVDALVDAGFLTVDRRLHDWADWTGAHLERMEAERARVAAWRARKAGERDRTGTATATERAPNLRDDTRPDDTRPDQTILEPTSGSGSRRDWSTGIGRPIWDAFDAALGAARTTSERGRRSGAVRDLVRAGVDADAVRRAIAAWPRVFPTAAMTETAVAAHVTRLASEGDGPVRAVRARGVAASVVAAVTEAAGIPPGIGAKQ
jgi:hypothetical protein